MHNHRHLIFLVLLAAGLQGLRAQCLPTSFDLLDVNQVRARYYNGGDMFWDLTGNPIYEVPAGSGRHSAFASAFWIGGLDQTQSLAVAAQTYRQQGNDYYTGPLRTTHNYDCGWKFDIPLDPVYNGTLALSSGKVMVCYKDGFKVYDPTTGNVITRILPLPRLYYRPFELPDGRIILFGDDQYPNIQDLYVVDNTNFLVSTLPSLNYFHRNSAATVLNNGKVLITGLLGCEIFDPATNLSTTVAGMNVGRGYHAQVILPNGNVLAMGGSSTLGGAVGLSSTEVYDPVANTWTSGPSLLLARNRPRVTELSTGELIVCGGAINSGLFEHIDPATLSITAGGNYGGGWGECAVMRANNDDLVVIADRTLRHGSPLMSYTPAVQSFRFANQLGFNPSGATGPNGVMYVQYLDSAFVEIDPMDLKIQDSDWQHIWNLRKTDIDQFLVDFANNAVNFSLYPDIETWPGNGNVAAGEQFYLAPFIDVNMDGYYRPAQDGDYPCIMGDQALWWVYNADGPHTETGSVPMNLQVEVMAYAYDCGQTNCPDPNIDYTTFYHVEFSTRGSAVYNDLYLGQFMDVDLGNYVDDYVGCDTNLNLAFVYNGDADDEGASGYGATPPAMGSVILNSSINKGMTGFMYYENDFTVHGNPETPAHYYGYLQGIWKDGQHVVANGLDGHPATAPGPQTDFMFPGDAGFCGGPATGWTMGSAGILPFDRRWVQSVGPASISETNTFTVDYALVWAQGTDHLNSVCELKTSVANIQAWWDSLSHGCFNIITDQEGEIVSELDEAQVYPNPAEDRVKVELPHLAMEDYDVELLDLRGVRLLHSPLATGSRSVLLNVRDLPAGLYLVRISGEGESLTRRLVISH